LALLTATAQSACLGERDAGSPVIAVIFSGLANVAGDALLVPRFGVAGAALATVAAQGVGAAYLISVLRRRQREFLECNSGYPLGLTRIRLSMLSLPRRRAADRFLALAAPAFVALLGKVIFMNSLTIAAAGLGTVALAAHQVSFQLWLFFCRAGDALGAAAQAFLPAALAQRNPLPTRRLILRLARASVVWGIGNSLAALSLPLFAGPLFTRDLAVQAAVFRVAPLLGAGLLLHCATLMLEGVLLACQRGKWLAKVYWLNSAVFVSLLWIGGRLWGSLAFVWVAMVIFQVVRLSEFSTRVWGDHWRSSNGSLTTAVPTAI